MTEITTLTVFAGLPVRELERAVDWYSQLFGRAPDGRPTPDIAEYYLAAGRTPEHGTLQLRADHGRSGGGVATLNVADIDAVTTVLEGLGVPFEPQEFPADAVEVSSVTVGTFLDPDGNAITVVQPHLRDVGA